jgi:SAM-dependent methyltransferase
VADSEGQPPRFVTHLIGWYAMTALAVGSRTGLLDALVDSPGTAEQIASRAGVDPRNAVEWLRAMTAAGHATYDAGRFGLSPETAMVLGPGFPVDARAVVEWVAGASSTLDAVAEAVRSGRGIDPGTYNRAFGAPGARINTPIYRAALVDEWIGGVPGLADRLQQPGARIGDLACGNGDAAATMAQAFPTALVVGYDNADLAPSAPLPGNVTISRDDVRTLADADFDLVTCLDSFHHFGEPSLAARQARGLLRPGGVLLVAESALSGDLSADAGDPMSVIPYASSLLYCLQENLAQGGTGVSSGDGPDWLTDALATSGFHDVTSRESPTGYRITTATA